MKQIIQDLKSGATILEEVPVPQVKAGYVFKQLEPWFRWERSGCWWNLGRRI